MIAERPRKCWGKAKHKHRRGCRKGRPLCRWRRSAPCLCGAYHYPHRARSGRSGDVAAMNAFIWGPAERVAGAA